MQFNPDDYILPDNFLQTKETKVVRIRRKDGMIIQGCDIYIGRRMTMGGWNLEESPFANPYKIKEYGSADIVCALYETYIRNKPDLIAILPILRGKTLGCWCENPEKCHGSILIKLLNEYYPA